MRWGALLRLLDGRWLWGSPLLLATLCSFGFGLAAILDVAGALRRAEGVRAEVATELARLATEAAAIQCFATHESQVHLADGEFDVHGVPDGELLLLSTRSTAGESWRFTCRRLSGAAPACFAERLVTTDPEIAARVGEGVVVAPDALPQLDRAALAAAPRAEGASGFRLDPALALLHWQGGTEAPDFVFDRFGTEGWTPPKGGLVVVPGHLWFAPSVSAYEWHLEQDLVVVVEGNLYVGASARISGPGRLVLVTTVPTGAQPFVDRDGNGRWSAGEPSFGRDFAGVIEGGGNVYLGLPSQHRALEVGASIVVGGELHLTADAAVDGALVLSRGLTELVAGARLRLRGEALFNVQRERVPGFCTTGAPRPGLLALVGGGLREPQQPLYETSPAR